MELENPFFITGYHSPAYFCDRDIESKTIVDALANGRNVTLLAPRRMGKTGLIKNVLYKLSKVKNAPSTVYIDIYSTQSLSEFIELFASSVLGKLSSPTQKGLQKIGSIFKNLRPFVTFDDITGMPRFGVDVANNREEATLDEIFTYLSSLNHRVVIAIDEFQQIAQYDNKGVEALLRSHIQFAPNVNFIFAGSKQHIMEQMFLSAKRPFYQSTQTLSIGTIDRDVYYDFAARFFKKLGVALPRPTFDKIYDDFDGHTWYVQSVLNRLYGYRVDVTQKMVGVAIDDIVAGNEYSYQSLLNAYPTGSVRLLKAIAKQRVVGEINAGEFIAKYKLVGASSVNSALKRLVDNELVYKTDVGYIVYDRFMSLWMARLP